MKVERFEVSGLAQWSYAVSDGGEMVVVDAIRDVGRYVAYAEREGLRIVAVVETHIHADFAAGSGALVAAARLRGDAAELALSGYDAGERYVYAMEHRRLMDGEAVRVGGVRLEVLHTPGHTPEHLSFLLRGADGELAGMFSGDFLFAGALGRPDLLGEEARRGLARELYKSVTERVKGLPDGLRVYPGHGAGSLCGAGLSDRAETTLGFERGHNPFFGLEEAEFVERILGSVPPMPAYYPRMKELNAAGAPVLAELPGGAALSVEAVQGMVREGGVTLLDVRGVEAFAEGHVPGAVSLGLEGNLAMWAGWLLDAAAPMVLTGEGGPEVEARQALGRVGIDGVVGTLEGGFAAWVAAGWGGGGGGGGWGVQTVQVVGPDGLGEALVLDVRNDAELASGVIPGAVHVALGELGQRLDEVERGRPVVAVCESGYRAMAAASLLQRAGFAGVRMLRGGMGAWRGR
jgi:hydroxyacylglutathione hydrolase